MEEKVELKIGKKHIIATIALVLITSLLEYSLLRTLSVYNTAIGNYLLAGDLLINGILLGGLALAGLLIAGYFKRNLAWTGYYVLMSIGCLASLIVQANNGLGLDVNYVWILNKTGFDALNLQYLNGLSITFAFLLVALLFLSDCRVSRQKGKDGKKHFYVHSKIVGLIRWFIAKEDEKIGDNPDYPVVAKVEEEPYEEGWGRFKRKLTRKKMTEPHWNDKVRLFSFSYGIWATIKFVIGFIVASTIASSFALRYLIIQGYLEQAGMNWLDLIQRYLGIAWMRFTGTVTLPTNYPITQAVTFEVFQFFQPLIFWFCVVWAIRLVLGLIGEGITVDAERGYAHFASNFLSRCFATIGLIMLPFVAAIPTWVFDVSTPYSAWQQMLIFGFIVSLALVFRFVVRFSSFETYFENLIGILSKGRLLHKTLKIAGIVSLIVLLLSPSIVSWATVGPYMQGRRYEYVWKPAYIPTIDFTRWAYELNGIEKTDATLITTNETETLKKIRIFTLEAAKLNMKPRVGGVNWMSIDPSDVDIVYKDGVEYWTTVLTLVRPPYQGDVDVWRAEHMLLTHSEKILMQDAATTNILDVKEIFGLNETPQIYYGEEGLWKEVDEVYLNIPGFAETHLPEYQGPLTYNDEPDYVYQGFWRAWKFSEMWRWDFAQGDYGDISALTVRDVNERISKILLPGVNKESDAYPVVDNKGNIYLLYWLWITRDSPHGFDDYPENTLNQMARRFAVALVNLKNGEIDGYLMNKEKDDYLLSFYRSFYAQWDKPIPSWLEGQVRYPEEFLEKQIEVYDWYFQDDFQKWQRNEFYELTLDNSTGSPIEDVRYIVMPINGKLTWCAVRLVEWYKGTTRNLAGMYVAPCGNETGKVYFVDFKGQTVIGPSVALSTVSGNQEVKKHPAFDQWKSGNILMYSIDERFYYVIPYYKEEADMLLPQMIAVVNAQDQSMGFYAIQNPKDSDEISMATTYAFQRIGVQTTEKTVINGTLVAKNEYIESGNTRWLLNIQLTDGTTIEVLAKIEKLTTREGISKIVNLKIGDTISVRIDTTRTVTEILP
jgi:hypothetical protein